MDLLGLFFVGGLVGVDGLDWFIGDYGMLEVGGVYQGQYWGQLGGDDLFGLVGFVLFQCFVDVEYWDQVGMQGGGEFVCYQFVGFIVVLVVFGMVDQVIVGVDFGQY